MVKQKSDSGGRLIMMEIIKIATFIVVFVLAIDIFKLIWEKLVNDLNIKQLKFVFVSFFTWISIIYIIKKLKNKV